jgi:uncharacterized protein YijF (DUF1287 family)
VGELVAGDNQILFDAAHAQYIVFYTTDGAYTKEMYPLGDVWEKSRKTCNSPSYCPPSSSTNSNQV